MKKEKIAWQAATLVLILTGFVIGIKQLREPDLWWQLRTGEWILQHGKVMAQDVFSYTFSGTPWVNVKWGFEVIIALLAKIGGPEFIMIFQSVINVLLLHFIWKIYQKMRGIHLNATQSYPDAAFILTAWLVLAGIEYRMNGRPEIISHLFTLVYLYFMINYRTQPGKFILWLIPLQALWANLHEAYGTGMVMVIAFAAAEIGWPVLTGKQKIREAFTVNKYLLLTLLGCLVAPAFHPYGIKMIWHPVEIFRQVGANKFTTELFDITTRDYWQKEAWIALLIAVVTLPGFFIQYQPEEVKNKKQKSPLWLRPFNQIGPGYLVLYLLFLYLATTAYRNIVFFIIVAAPLFALNLRWLGQKYLKKNAQGLAVPVALTIFGIVCYGLIVSNTWYKFADNDRYRYGLKVDEYMNPVGVADFIQKNHLQGHEFSDFLVSNYLLWKLQPGFKTFIDLRDLDVFPEGFFKNFGYLDYNPAAVMELDSDYHFNYAVLYRGSFGALHSFFTHDSRWAPVYADPVAAIYMRRNAANDLLVNRFWNNGDVFHAPIAESSSALSKGVSYVFNPVWKPEIQPAVPVTLIAADYYLSVGQNELAIQKAKYALDHHESPASAWQVLGDIQLQAMSKSTNPVQADSLLKAAVTDYNNAIGEDRHLAKGYYGLGRASLMQRDYASASAYFKKAVKEDASLENAWVGISEACNGLMQNGDPGSKLMNERIHALEKALALDPGNLRIEFYLGISYGQSGNCSRAAKLLKSAPSFPGARPEDVQVAKNILIQCGE
jgi:tetratricopeptide (TPR) repeat protein